MCRSYKEKKHICSESPLGKFQGNRIQIILKIMESEVLAPKAVCNTQFMFRKHVVEKALHRIRMLDVGILSCLLRNETHDN